MQSIPKYTYLHTIYETRTCGSFMPRTILIQAGCHQDGQARTADDGGER